MCFKFYLNDHVKEYSNVLISIFLQPNSVYILYFIQNAWLRMLQIRSIRLQRNGMLEFVVSFKRSFECMIFSMETKKKEREKNIQIIINLTKFNVTNQTCFTPWRYNFFSFLQVVVRSIFPLFQLSDSIFCLNNFSNIFRNLRVTQL